MDRHRNSSLDVAGLTCNLQDFGGRIMKTVLLSSVALVCLASSLTLGATIHIPVDQSSIQSGIDASASGDTVLVTPGSYSEQLDFRGKKVVVISERGAGVTFLEPASTPVVMFTSNEPFGTELSGFTFRNTNGEGHIRVYNGAQPTIRRNVFVGLNPVLIIQCSSAHPRIERNLFYQNHVGNSCIGVTSGAAEIINNTFDGNSRGFYSFGSTTAKNNIVTRSGDYGIFGSYTNLSYNDVWGNGLNYDGGAVPGVGSLSVDPQFTNLANHDYSLQVTSPCINAGDPSPEYDDPDGTRSDIGAFPLAVDGVPYPLFVNYGPASWQEYVYSLTPSFYWSFYDTGSNSQQGFEIEVGTDSEWTVAEKWSSGQVASSDTSITYAGRVLSDTTTYYLRLRLSDGLVWGNWHQSYFITHEERVIGVPSEKPSIQSAVDAAITGDSILVEPGIYYEQVDFRNKVIVVKSLSGRLQTTIISPYGGIPTVIFGPGCNTGSVIDGFTIRDAISAPAISVASGGGATIKNNRLTNISGAALQSGGTVRVLDNDISESSYGATLANGAGSEITNNEIASCSYEAVTVSNSPLTSIVNNVVHDNGSSIRLISSRRSKINGNSVYDNTSAVQVGSSDSVQVSGNTLTSNRGGLTIQSSSNLTVTGNSILRNEGGMSAYDGSLSQFNLNVVALNGWAIILGNFTNASLQSNTIALNGSVGISAEYSSTGVLKNNVVAYNSGWGIKVAGGASSLSASYNDVFGNRDGGYFGFVPGPGSIQIDPQLCDTSSLNLMLSSISPCVGSGENGVNMGALGIGCPIPAADLPSVSDFTIGEFEDSLHVVSHDPWISWVYHDSQQRPHTRSEIQVGTDDDWTVAEMWQPPTFQFAALGIQYEGAPLQDGSTYFARVRVANDSNWSFWKVAKFRMNSHPTAVALSSPADGHVVTTDRPTLRVANATDPDGDQKRYLFEVYSDSSLGHPPVVYASGILEGTGQTTWKTDQLTQENGRYWWRARATDGYENGPWSAIWSLWVNAENESPAAFNLRSPENGGTIYAFLPYFSWLPTADPDPLDQISYSLYLSLDAEFYFVRVIDEIRASSFALADTLPWGTHFWWKVRATDRGGLYCWSSQIFDFRTFMPGDANSDTRIDISDAVYLIGYIFMGEPEPSPQEMGDANCDQTLDISDVVYLVTYIFAGGQEPCIPSYDLSKWK
jgi:parallel beta-helix repeat protein